MISKTEISKDKGNTFLGSKFQQVSRVTRKHLIGIRSQSREAGGSGWRVSIVLPPGGQPHPKAPGLSREPRVSQMKTADMATSANVTSDKTKDVQKQENP